jgi:hypothetical protein
MVKYTPLNLNFLANSYSPQQDSIRNTAAMIMSNAGWDQEANAEAAAAFAKAKKKAQAEFDAQHRQTFLGSFFDLLSTPLYGIANAMDEGLAGHQGDSNDNPLEDALKTVGGVGTGLVRGVGAGLRGATGMLDALPGVDINDEWQSDHTDKTHFSDVAIRKELGMSTAEAMKPENWAKIQPKLEEINKKPWYDKTLFQAAVPNDLEDPDVRQKFFRNEMLAGIPLDIAGDPLNFVLPGVSFAKKATEGITEGVDAARAAEATANPIINSMKLKNVSGFTPKAGLNEASPVVSDLTYGLKAKPKIATPEAIVAPPGSITIPDEVVSAVTIGGKVRKAQSLKAVQGTSDVITQEAFDAAKALRNANHPDWMITSLLNGAKHGLSPAAIQTVIKHLDDGTEPVIAAKSGIAATPEAVPDVTVAPPDGFVAETPFDLAKGKVKTLADIGRREKTKPIEGVSISSKDQKNLVKGITTLAAAGKKGWIYKAANLLGNHPSTTFRHTEKFLQDAIRMVDAKGLSHDPVKFAQALRARIAEDAKFIMPVEGEKAAGNERRVMNTLTDVVIRPEAPKLKVAEARIANSAIRKLEAEILGGKGATGTGPALARAIQENRNVGRASKVAGYSGPQQARVWNQITSSLKFANARKFDKAVRILRATEDYFMSKGVIPFSASKVTESVPLRLSQVAEALGPQVLGKSHAFITGILRGDPKAYAQLTKDQIDAINALRASEAFASAPAVQRGLSEAKTAADTIAKTPASLARRKEMLNAELARVKQLVIDGGGGAVGAHVAEKYMATLVGKGDPVNNVLNVQKLNTQAWLGKVGKSAGVAANDPDFVRSVTNAITRASDLPNAATLGTAIGVAAKVKEWAGARFNAAYGVQDMRDIFLRQQGSAMISSARRAKLINALGREFDPSNLDLWHEAFRTAQMNGISDGRVADLHKQIAAVMENLVGGSGLRAGAIADSTVAGRSRLLLDELNANMKRFGLGEFEFAAKKVTDATGVEHDFSKGMDWLKSWEAWNVKNPYEFIHRIQNVMEYSVREKNMFDEIISRFASPAKKGEVRFGVEHPRLKGFYFTQVGAEQAKTFVKMLDEIAQPNAKSLQYFDHVLSKLKAALTIYIPGHHWTNLIGGLMNNWIAGVNKPIRYEQAMKTMLAQKGRYGDFANFEKLTGPKALEQAMARSLIGPDAGLVLPAAGTKTVITMRNGQKVTADMIYMAAMKEGILPSAKVLEEVGSDVTSILDKWRPARGYGQRGVHAVSEVREHIPRLALFIDRLAKSRGGFGAAVDDGARAVRKWHPDGLDLTKFERGFMKRVFPFYSWTRKSIPLAIESALVAAPKVMAYPRIMEAIGLMNGIDPAQGVRDPFPTDQMFPDWLRNRGIGPIAGNAGNYSVYNPSTPVLDIMNMIGNPGQTAIDNLNPMGKVPVEVWQGQPLGRAQPLGSSNEAWLDYAAKQIPVVSQAGRASGSFGVSKNTKAEGFPNWTNILNMLTGLKKVDTGKYQKSSQFDLRDYFKSKADQQGR